MMTTPTAELHPDFSSPGATALPWSEVLAVIETAEIFWLSTVRRDGRPHVTPLPAMWLDGALHFCTGPAEQKARNLAANPQCVLTTGTNAFRSGLDVVVEGRAERVTDMPLLRRLASMWRTKLDWPFEAVEGGFHDPESSPSPPKRDGDAATAHVFRVAPTKILAFGKGEPFSQTRYRF
jgi:general stress protein 26